TPVPLQMLAAAAIRFTHVTLTFAFTLFVLTGGVDVYTKSYESVTGWTPLPQGQAAALVLTGISIVVWTVFASIVQVLVYRRGLARWPETALASEAREPEPLDPPAGGFDPRAVALAAAVLGWVEAESRRFRRAAPGEAMMLRAHVRDAALVVLALACGVAFAI